MANLLQQEGTFRGAITGYGLYEAESGACSVKVTVKIDDIFHEGQWHDWRGEDMEAHGELWVIKKDGGINESSVKSLITAAGWDGSLLSLTEGTWQPQPVQIVVTADNYKDETRFRIAYINEYDRMPGGGNVTTGKAQELQTRFGSALRAVAGNLIRNQMPAPASAPVKPKAAKPVKPAPQPVAEVAGVADTDDETPF
jgi:hypothetical protein